MRYDEVRRLTAEVVRSNGRLMLWSAHREAGASPNEQGDSMDDWAVVLIDTWRGQTYQVRDYARLMEDFPALPDVSRPGISVGWHATESLVDGRMSWADVRLALYAIEQAYPACRLESFERGANGWACQIACAPSLQSALAEIPQALAEVYIPGDSDAYVTALTLDAAKAIAQRCSSDHQ